MKKIALILLLLLSCRKEEQKPIYREMDYTNYKDSLTIYLKKTDVTKDFIIDNLIIINLRTGDTLVGKVCERQQNFLIQTNGAENYPPHKRENTK